MLCRLAASQHAAAAAAAKEPRTLLCNPHIYFDRTVYRSIQRSRQKLDKYAAMQEMLK